MLFEVDHFTSAVLLWSHRLILGWNLFLLGNNALLIHWCFRLFRVPMANQDGQSKPVSLCRLWIVRGHSFPCPDRKLMFSSVHQGPFWRLLHRLSSHWQYLSGCLMEQVLYSGWCALPAFPVHSVYIFPGSGRLPNAQVLFNQLLLLVVLQSTAYWRSFLNFPLLWPPFVSCDNYVHDGEPWSMFVLALLVEEPKYTDRSLRVRFALSYPKHTLFSAVRRFLLETTLLSISP